MNCAREGSSRVAEEAPKKPTGGHQRPAGRPAGLASYRLFTGFAERVWKHLNLPPLTPIQVDIANNLQFGDSRLLIEAFRGVGKSWLVAAFVVWALYQDPQRRILIASASKDYANTMSVFIKRLIDELPECAWLRPRGDQRSSMVQFDVGPALADKSPSVKSEGIKGQITGSRADIIIADDVEIPRNSMTPALREELMNRVSEFTFVIKPAVVDGVPVAEEKTPRIIFLGTPQSEMSIYTGMAERGYTIRIWPARVPADPSVYKGHLAPFIQALIAKGVKAGTPTDPKRFTHLDLLDREVGVGKSAFQLQYQLDTTLADGLKFPLKVRDMPVMRLDPETGAVKVAWGEDHRTRLNDLQSVGFTGDYWGGPVFISNEYAPWQGTVMAVDPSGKGLDETGFVVVKHLTGKAYLVDAGGLPGGYDRASLEALAHTAKRHKVMEIIVEENFGGGMFVALLKPVLAAIWPCSIVEVRSTKQKELRIIETLEPILNQHKLVVDRKVVEDDLLVSDPAYSLFYQMTRITKERGALSHDDRLDALAMAIAHLQRFLGVDEGAASEDAKQQTLEELLEAWDDGLATAMGWDKGTVGRPQGKNWHGA